MKGLILDLRFNPGGLLDPGRRSSSATCSSTTAWSCRSATGRSNQQEERHYDRPGFGGSPTSRWSVLVNGKSASASEIVSAGLKDHERALIVGERTYGKGSVQNVDGFGPTGGEFKITVARYFPPKGGQHRQAEPPAASRRTPGASARMTGTK